MGAAAAEVWSRMCNVKDTEVKMTHAGYLKLYSLSQPSLPYDVVLLDEAQDCNPAIAAIVSSQRCARILVGDAHQAIYGFLGAHDALGDARARSGVAVLQRQLTRSFRFGPNIADIANFVLRRYKGERHPLLGCGQHEGQLLLGEDFPSISECQQHQPLDGCPAPPFAFVARTNAEVIRMGLRADDVGLEVAWVGGIQGYRLGLIRDLCLLALGEGKQAESAQVRTFGSLDALRQFAQRVDDLDILARIDLVRRHPPDDLLRRLKCLEAAAERRERSVAANTASATAPVKGVALTTVHKAKGLEWDVVVLGEDFAELPVHADPEEEAMRSPVARDEQEVNALYVALTRAKVALQPPRRLVSLYGAQAEAQSIVERHFAKGLGPCPVCGLSCPSHAQTGKLVVVGSASLRPLCKICATSAGSFAAPDAPLFSIFC